MIGKTLAHYEVTSLLGKGGMGEVYRARDTRLEREVALKMLPAELADDPERLARFRREAKVLAALNHPNIAGLHGFEEVGGERFLVMELAEGEDLAVAMERGAIPLEDALDIAKQIAAGLQEAHERGIVHRDLKPQNVKLTSNGGVKILDFGLALPHVGPEDSGDSAHSPTITAALTQAGTLMGTAAYMSPEQATGRVVDQRTDIWAFGVILYEMLTGKKLFAEETIGDILAAVIRAEPDWGELPADLPRDVERLLRRCLRKKRGQRLSAIADARLELEEVGSEEGADAASPTPGPWWPRRIWLVPLALGAALGLALGFLIRGDSAGPPGDAATPIVYSSIALPEETRLAGWSSPTVEFSPDGRVLAFVAQAEDGQYLYVRQLDQGRAVRVPESHGAEGPFFSPDGRWVGFGAGAISGNSREPRRLKKYSLDTGATSEVCEVGDYFGGCWRGDGTVFFVGIQPRGLWRVPAEGGTPTRVGDSEATDARGLAWPQVLPGDEEALVVVWEGSAGGRFHIIDLETGELSDLGVDGVFGRWTTSGHLVLVDLERTVHVRRFDAAEVRLGEGDVQVLDDITLSGNEAAVLAVSPGGNLVYSQGPVDGSRRDLSRALWIAEDGTRTPLDLEADFYSGVALSPDGDRLALSVDGRDLRIADLTRNTQLRLPRGDTTAKTGPLWTPDGESVVFTGSATGSSASRNLFLQPTDGVQPPRQLERRVGEFFTGSWVPGSRQLLHYGFLADDRIRTRIFLLDLDADDPPREFLDDERAEITPALSPDGRWLAYASNETGPFEIFLRSFPDLMTKVPIGVGRRPKWSAAGDRLYFVQREGRTLTSIWVAAMKYDGERIEPGAARKFTDLDSGLLWDLDPKGRGVLVFLGVPGAGEIRSLEMVQGWSQELERVLPVGARRP